MGSLLVVRLSKSRLFHFLVFQKLLDIDLTQRALGFCFEPLKNACLMEMMRAVGHLKHFFVGFLICLECELTDHAFFFSIVSLENVL